MLYWAAIFLVIALVTTALGFGGIAAAAFQIAQLLFGVFLVLIVIALAAKLLQGRISRP